MTTIYSIFVEFNKKHKKFSNKIIFEKKFLNEIFFTSDKQRRFNHCTRTNRKNDLDLIDNYLIN